MAQRSSGGGSSHGRPAGGGGGGGHHSSETAAQAEEEAGSGEQEVDEEKVQAELRELREEMHVPDEATMEFYCRILGARGPPPTRQSPQMR